MNEFNYYAFISYKREDEKWAKWLQSKLESYKLPSTLQKQYNLDEARIKPVFRDKTDLSIGTVKNALAKELESSKYLIVICSPRSAKSQWVDLEVTNFIEAGRVDYIIPFIIEGSPYSADPLTECYTPAMLSCENSILGVNINEVGKNIAFYRVVAGLLEIHADDVIKREKRIKRKKVIRNTVLSFLLLCIGIYMIWYYTPKTKYYADYVIVNHIPEGIFPLDSKEIKHRGSCYKFTYQVEDLKKIMHINSAGRAIPEDNMELRDRPPIMKLSYDEYGRLQKIKYYDEFMSQIMIAVYGNYNENYNEVIEFEQEDGTDDNYTYLLYTDCTSIEGLFGLYNDRYRNTAYQRSAISKFELINDKDNKITGIKFLNRFGMQAGDMNELYQINYTYDDLGRITKIVYCDISGMPSANNQGCSSKEYTYQGADLIKITWLDINNKPINNQFGYAMCKREYDNNGNCVYEQYFDKAGEATTSVYGYAALKNTYDRKGNRMEAKGYDITDNLVVTGVGYAGIRYQYDDVGNIVRLNYLGVNNEPCRNQMGVFGCEYLYNDDNQLTKESYIDAENHPMADKDGIAYRKEGWQKNNEFYDINGQLVCNSEGFAKIEYVIGLPELGNICRTKKYTVCYDAYGNIVNSTYGFASITRGYDKYNRLLFEAFFNADGEYVQGPSGYKSVNYTYDLLDNITKQEFNDGTKLVEGPTGYSQRITMFSSANKLLSESFYNELGQLVNCANGYAQLKIEYNMNGNEMERSFIGENGLLVLGLDGYARSTTQYYNNGAGFEVYYWDVDGKPINAVYGFAHTKTFKNSGDTEYQTLFYDAEGKDITKIRSGNAGK